MRDFLSARAREIKPSGIRKYFDLLETMEGAISLGVGEPDFVTPPNIRNAGIRALEQGCTQYTGNRGLPELRALISEYLKVRFGLDYPAEHTIVTVGASEGIDLALRAICDFGDEILLPDPAYVAYSPIVSMCGGVPVSVTCRLENGFILTPQAIKDAITPKTKAIILPYPNNPTGSIMTKEELEKIVPVIKEHDLLVISDEIYSELTYGGKHVSIASLAGMKERTVLIGGFSKAFAMTGWRVGYVCAPERLDFAMLKIHQYTALCAPRISQHAAIAALSEGLQDGFSAVEKMRAEYDRRRKYLVKALNALGLSCFEPRGAFYVFPSVKRTGMTGEAFAERLLKEARVAVIPGNAFGDCGTFHVRCSYATGMDALKEALLRIGRFLEKTRRKAEND